MKARNLAVAALVVVTIIWGTTFIVIKDAVSLVDPSDFLLVRFIIASAILLIAFGPRLMRTPRKIALTCTGVGVVFGVGQILQAIGLAHTAASVSGFLTAAYVVITPFIAWAMFKAAITKRILLSSVIAMVGIGIISLSGFAMGLGEVVTLLSAVIFALQIILVGFFARDVSAIEFASFQTFGLMIAMVPTAMIGGVHIPSNGSVWFAIVYLAVVASILVLFLQSWAQKHLDASTTAVIMALEPVFAAVFAFTIGGEAFTTRIAIGGALVLAAIILAELPSKNPYVVTEATLMTGEIPALTGEFPEIDFDAPVDYTAQRERTENSPGSSGSKDTLAHESQRVEAVGSQGRS